MYVYYVYTYMYICICIYICIHMYICIYVYIKHIHKTLQCIDDVHKAPRFVWKQLLTRNQVIIQKNVTMFFSLSPFELV